MKIFFVFVWLYNQTKKQKQIQQVVVQYPINIPSCDDDNSKISQLSLKKKWSNKNKTKPNGTHNQKKNRKFEWNNLFNQFDISIVKTKQSFIVFFGFFCSWKSVFWIHHLMGYFSFEKKCLIIFPINFQQEDLIYFLFFLLKSLNKFFFRITKHKFKVAS